MKIKSITLHNFRQFKDITFNFSIDKKKNVSVILAENSTGKTTLMQSINWCLYGDEETQLDNKNYLLNKYVRNKTVYEKEDFWVKTVIIEDGVEYTITRKREVFVKNLRSTKEDLLTLEYRNNLGETIILGSFQGDSKRKINRMINKILTREMSRYFIFDGERINNLGSNNNKSKKDIQQAITAINGLPILENSINSMKRLAKTYRNELAKATKDSDIDLINDRRNKLEENIKVLNDLLDQINDEIIKKEKRIYSLDNELSQYDKIEVFITERKNIEKRVSDNIKYINEKQDEILKDVMIHHRKSIIYLLQKKYADLKFNEEYKTKSIPNMDAGAIDNIIERGVCICGEPLTDKHLKHLYDQRNYQPPISNSVLIKYFKLDIEMLTRGIDAQYEDIEKSITNYYETVDNLAENRSRIDELNEIIGHSDSEEIKEKNKERIALKAELRTLIEKSGGIKKNIEIDYMNLEKLKKEFERKVKEKNKYDYQALKVELIEEAINFLEEKENKEKMERKHSIEEKANEHFKDIIYKSKKIELDNNFEYTVKEPDGSIASPSEGERVSISISLILAIIDAHKEKIKQTKSRENNSIDVEIEKEFCIVMDAAFATLDNQFSQRISQKLPQSIEQIILFSTQRQFEGSVHESLKPYLQKLYKLTIPRGEKENSLTNEDLEEILTGGERIVHHNG